jgi:two-component system, response regulator, stage 0 sporulation protein F
MGHRNDLHATRRNILVADDDDDMRALMVNTLRSDGYAVVEARDGAELLEILSDALEDTRARPDILVTDIKMPRLSGLGVLQALRRAHVRMPVILVTAFSDESMHVVAKRLGAVGVLQKPFDVDDLRTAVMNASAAFERDMAHDVSR